jgi:hypothetical protein
LTGSAPRSAGTIRWPSWTARDGSSASGTNGLGSIFFLKGCPGWGANPGSFDFVYFLIPSLYRWATAARPGIGFMNTRFEHIFILKWWQYMLSQDYTTTFFFSFQKPEPLRFNYLKRMWAECFSSKNNHQLVNFTNKFHRVTFTF